MSTARGRRGAGEARAGGLSHGGGSGGERRRQAAPRWQCPHMRSRSQLAGAEVDVQLPHHLVVLLGQPHRGGGLHGGGVLHNLLHPGLPPR